MKTLNPLLLLLLLPLFIQVKCKKDKQASEEKLPPATQTGAGTFGCLLNGKVWLPAGLLLETKIARNYDPGFKGGSFSMQAQRKLYNSNNDRISYTIIDIGCSYLDKSGVYSLMKRDTSGTSYTNFDNNCNYFPWRNEGASIIAGEMHITKLDMNIGIISGTFFFTLVKPNCDTIKVTEGRFDFRL